MQEIFEANQETYEYWLKMKRANKKKYYNIPKEIVIGIIGTGC